MKHFFIIASEDLRERSRVEQERIFFSVRTAIFVPAFDAALLVSGFRGLTQSSSSLAQQKPETSSQRGFFASFNSTHFRSPFFFHGDV